MKQLYCQQNQLSNLVPLKQLTNLITVHCNHNQLVSLKGINQEHAESLKSLVGLPNPKLPDKEIRRLETLGISVKRG